MIEFFKINDYEDTLDFINTKILDEKYIWKCKSYIRSEKSISFTKNQVFWIWAYWDYKKAEPPNENDCWEYWHSRSINYFERRWDYLIYINAWQDYNWVDFSLIEFK